MVISIKSETDSRFFIYPLMKCLYNYGTIALYTSNPMCARLIENELEGGFKNIRVIVNVEADLEAVYEADEYYQDKYDFVICDNMGAIDYDVLIAVVTGHISESYISELLYVISDDNTYVVRLGKAAPKPKVEKDKGGKGKGKKGEPQLNIGEEEEEEEVPTFDNFNKWHKSRTDSDVLKEKLSSKNSVWCKPPAWQEVEDMESRQFLSIPDGTMIKDIYRIFKNYLSVDERQFTKGACVKNEGSSDLTGTDIW